MPAFSPSNGTMLFRKSRTTAEQHFSDVAPPLCRECARTEADQERECGLGDLDRGTLRRVMQTSLELDFNLGTVEQAYKKQGLDSRDIQEMRSRLFHQRVLLVQVNKWLDDPRKPFEARLNKKGVAYAPACFNLQKLPTTLDWVIEVASKLDRSLQSETPETPRDKTPDYRSESAWTAASRAAAAASIPLKGVEYTNGNVMNPVLQYELSTRTHIAFGESC